jgi:hypothetical protein
MLVFFLFAKATVMNNTKERTLSFSQPEVRIESNHLYKISPHANTYEILLHTAVK